jgi:tetratricopeptide (TPR) repeat protein
MHGTELFAFARSTEGKLQFKARFPMPLVVAVGATAIAATLLANRSLQQAAVVDAVVRATAPVSNSDPETLLQSVQQLTSFEKQGFQHSEVFYGLARLQAALLDDRIRAGLRQSSNDFLKELAEKSNLTARLKKLRTLLFAAQQRGELDATGLFVEIDQLLKLGDEQREGVVLFAQKALQRSPLFPEPRLLMAQVDSRTELTPQESIGLAQFMSLRGYSRGALTNIAELSATTNNWDQASMAWSRLAARNPNLVVPVLESAETLGHPSSLELVPEDDLSMLLAGESLLKKGTARLEFLTRVRETLERRTPEDRALRARWYSVIAQVYELEGNTAKADEYSLKTIAAEPAKLLYRTEFISRLRDRGDLIAAKQYCRTSLEELRRSEPRIEKLLEAIQADIDARNAEILK